MLLVQHPTSKEEEKAPTKKAEKMTMKEGGEEKGGWLSFAKSSDLTGNFFQLPTIHSGKKASAIRHEYIRKHK